MLAIRPANYSKQGIGPGPAGLRAFAQAQFSKPMITCLACVRSRNLGELTFAVRFTNDRKALILRPSCHPSRRHSGDLWPTCRRCRRSSPLAVGLCHRCAVRHKPSLRIILIRSMPLSCRQLAADALPV